MWVAEASGERWRAAECHAMRLGRPAGGIAVQGAVVRIARTDLTGTDGVTGEGGLVQGGDQFEARPAVGATAARPPPGAQIVEQATQLRLVRTGHVGSEVPPVGRLFGETPGAGVIRQSALRWPYKCVSSTVARSQSIRIRLTSSGLSTLFTTVASAPFSNRTSAVETSSVSTACTSRPAMARISDHGPSRSSSRSIWWMPWPMAGPPPSLLQLPRQGTE